MRVRAPWAEPGACCGCRRCSPSATMRASSILRGGFACSNTGANTVRRTVIHSRVNGWCGPTEVSHRSLSAGGSGFCAMATTGGSSASTAIAATAGICIRCIISMVMLLCSDVIAAPGHEEDRGPHGRDDAEQLASQHAAGERRPDDGFAFPRCGDVRLVDLHHEEAEGHVDHQD